MGDVCEILDSKRKPVKKENRKKGKYPYYGATGILDYVNNYIFDEKLVLVGEDGAKWNSGDKTAFITEGKYWVNNHAHVLKPNRKKLLDEILVYSLNAKNLTSFVTGVTVPKLNQQKLRQIQIPLPPLAEQKRIVAVLDKTFTTIDKIKNNTEKNLANTKELWQSYLQQSFNNPKKNWQQKKLGDVCEKLFAGGDVPKNNFSKTKTDKFNIPIFSNGIKDNGLYGFTNIKKVNKPSITISARGTIGYSVLRKETFYPIIRLIVLSPKEKLLDLFFLKYVLNNISFLNSGTAIPQLTVPMIKEYQITFPPLAEQKQITERLDYLSQKTTALQETYCKKIQNLIELKNSLLQNAFTGQL